ncbi:hypothetical protein FY034_07385 [Trichlorobacter lovleyi]|uniref:hypothetical protein n=1 Tax=Trichlorobacter lovleyi TaxID=313985 RepID=UPI00223ECEE4|nr:hypothetical protein [Trichlorobacter lovleyi]QOX78759.1 hypothetical protein FY034_07385 [Trichlorobacter lovleyi]
MRKLIGKMLVVILVLAVFGLAGNADRKDAEVTTATIKEVAAAGIVYSQPAAYRLQTPTHEQMDSVEALLVLQPLVRR